jgi:hypothetical protein
MIDWDALDAGRFERVVQILLRDRFGATAIDGSGGDRAQDSRLESADGLTVYEVKSFRKRLASSQKQQVKRSLIKSLELHSPSSYVLVTRSNPTPSERDWFMSLRPGDATTALEWYGVDWLDGAVSGREDLIAYVEGAEYKLLRRVKEHQLEQQAGLDGSKILNRMQSLLERSSEISPYWAWNYSTDTTGVTRQLVALRPESADEDPVSLQVDFEFSDDSTSRELARRLQDALDFGGDVELPGSAVSSIRVNASSDATRRLLADSDRTPDSVRIVSERLTEGFPKAAVLERKYGDGTAVELPVRFSNATGGMLGSRFEGTDASETLTVELALRHDRSESTLRLGLALAPGQYVHDVLPTLKLLTGGPGASPIRLKLGPEVIAEYNAIGPQESRIHEIFRFIWALDIVSKTTGKAIQIPREDLSPQFVSECIDIARALLGARVRLTHAGLSATVMPGRLGDFLRAVKSPAGALYFVPESITLELDESRFAIRRLAYYCPHMTLRDWDELVALSQSGHAGETSIHYIVEPEAGMFLLRAAEGHPEGWNLNPHVDGTVSLTPT